MIRYSLLLLAVFVLAISARANYTGDLRVYIVEPESRWDFNSGEDIHQGLLDILFGPELDLASGESRECDRTWDGSVDGGYQGVTPENIEVIVIAFNSEPHPLTDAYPPYGFWFTAYYTDACGAAQPGVPGANEVFGGFTHSVFLEEGSATWCLNCPEVTADLHALKASGSYPFHYASLVAETPTETEPAYSRLFVDLNRAGYPCCFFDGGASVGTGDIGYSEWEARLITSGERTVPDLDLVVAVEHLTSDQFHIMARIAYETPANTDAATPGAPTGDASGAAGTPLEFSATSTDVEADALYYEFDFGDGSFSSWLGPYASGAACVTEHTYGSDGTKLVKVRTKDSYGAESDWSEAFSVAVGGGCCQLRGDINGVDGMDISDLVYLVTYMFQQGPEPPCMEVADMNGVDGETPDISDLVYMVEYMFQQGPPPVPCP